MQWHTTRKRLGDAFMIGSGVEIGAGLHPVLHTQIERLYFCDKRDAAAFTAYFGRQPDYDILRLDEVRETFPHGADFVARHVLEHADDPIAILMEWIGLLRVRGVLYLSIPSHDSFHECGRLATPLRHILENYFFQRGAASFDSKQHIFSFALK